MFNPDGLNEKQLQAASYGPGNLLVLAGPGSGKTHTTLQRIFFLIDKLKVLPEKILVITFTKDAALNMQNRFIQMENFPRPVCFGTFHSVFFHILQSYFPHKKLKLITVSDKKKIINELVLKCMPDKKEAACFTDRFIQIMSFYKNTADFNLTLKRCGQFDADLFEKIFSSYEEKRKSNFFIDYDDMVMDCLNILEKDTIFRKKWQERFSYILIDEFQDINQVQYATVKLLRGKDTKLFSVGDDDQSIYGFRGASPECLKKYITDYNADVINLNINYRNPEEIIKAADKVIICNSDRIPKESFSYSKIVQNPENNINVINPIDTNPNESGLILQGFANVNEEYDFASKSLECIKGETKACLFRTNLGMQNFAVFLNKSGIHYCIKDKTESIYDHFIVKDLLAYLKFALDRNDLESALLIANKPQRGIDRELLAEGNNLQQILKIPENDLDFIKHSSLYLGVNYILNKIGYKNYLLNRFYDNPDKISECNEIIAWIKEDVKSFDTLSEYIVHQNNYKKEMNNHSDNDINCVILMTMHSAKGLEFENVIIPDCNEGNFPHGKLPDPDIISEERRLFYVGMTRASKKLFILYVNGNKERNLMPSRFLNNLLNN